MQSYLERYLQGEHVKVWAELVGLGSAIRDEPLRSDADAVAVEIMKRAKQNVGFLIERFKEIGYRFVNSDKAWTPPTEEFSSELESLESRYGQFPLTVRTWFEIVGLVNFMGTHPKLSQCSGYDWGGSDQLGCYGDPLFVSIPSFPLQSLVSFYLNFAESEEEEAAMEAEMPPPYRLTIGMSGINKAGQSGGGGVDILVPNDAFDAPLIDTDGYWTGTMFVSYLRTCFKWGGFPGLRGGWYEGQEWDPEHSREEINFLTKDLIPL